MTSQSNVRKTPWILCAWTADKFIHKMQQSCLNMTGRFQENLFYFTLIMRTFWALFLDQQFLWNWLNNYRRSKLFTSIYYQSETCAFKEHIKTNFKFLTKSKFLFRTPQPADFTFLVFVTAFSFINISALNFFVSLEKNWSEFTWDVSFVVQYA